MNYIKFTPTKSYTEKCSFSQGNRNNKINITIEQPDIRRYMGEISPEVIVLVTGWTEEQLSLASLRTAIANRGMAAVTFKHPIYYDPIKVMAAPKMRVDNIANVVQTVSDSYAKVSVAGHSMGGIDSTRAVLKKELEVSVLALMASAGLIKGDSFRRVSAGLAHEIIRERDNLMQYPQQTGPFAVSSLKRFVRNPVMVLNEGIATSKQYVGKHIGPIASSGVVVANLLAADDMVFPARIVTQDTSDLSIDIARIFAHARHDFTYTKPQEVAQFLVDVVGNADIIRQNRPNPFAISQGQIEEDLLYRNDQ